MGTGTASMGGGGGHTVGTCPHGGDPIDLCEYEELQDVWEIRKYDKACPLILVFNEEGAPCWYRICPPDEDGNIPEEESPFVVYDCEGRAWKQQAGKDAEAAQAALDKACAAQEAAEANADQLDALQEQVDNLPEDNFIVDQVFDATTGVSTTTLNDGTILTSTVVNPIVGTYTQTAGGPTVLPLPGGGSITLIAPHASTQTTTVAANGDIIITHTSGDGTTNVTTIPFDQMLGALTLAADGCTLVGTLDDGTGVSVPLCDLVSEFEFAQVENADGTVTNTLTHTSGDGTVTTAVWTNLPASVFACACQTVGDDVQLRFDHNGVTSLHKFCASLSPNLMGHGVTQLPFTTVTVPWTTVSTIDVTNESDCIEILMLHGTNNWQYSADVDNFIFIDQVLQDGAAIINGGNGTGQIYPGSASAFQGGEVSYSSHYFAAIAPNSTSTFEWQKQITSLDAGAARATNSSMQIWRIKLECV